ncbi:MAG: rod shape-determining protein MreC [Anaerolineae bacterium]|nr:rod shape-determining protein MreC [Thermoflexales bacterium]MDW8408222.1 rod shape-determining protein MreC [Anaerolineae bacterium]
MNRRSSRPLLAPILIAIAGIVLVLSLSSGLPSAAEGPLSTALTPLQELFSTLGKGIGDLFRSAGELQDLRQRVQALQRQVDELSIENLRLREFQAEVRQYRDLLNFASQNPIYDIVGADVIGIGARCTPEDSNRPGVGVCANVVAGDPSPFIRYITINAGRQHGIRVGMPVVGGGLALVGRVGQVNESSSHVQLLIDPNSYVNAQVVSSRATGVVAGQSDGSLHLQNVPQTDALQVDDIIVTSGLGGMLPAQLPIGRVERIISTDAALFKEAVVRPAVDFNRLEIVLVITAAPGMTNTLQLP